MFSVDVASAKRKCMARNADLTPCPNVIKNGEACLFFGKGSGQYRVQGNLCLECLSKMFNEVCKQNGEKTDG